MKMTQTYFLFLFLLFACSEDNNIINHPDSFHNSKYYQQEFENGTDQNHNPMLNPIDSGSIWEKHNYWMRKNLRIELDNLFINVVRDNRMSTEELELFQSMDFERIVQGKYIFIRKYYKSWSDGGYGHLNENVTEVKYFLNHDHLSKVVIFNWSHSGWWSQMSSYEEEWTTFSLTFSKLPFVIHNDTLLIKLDSEMLANGIEDINYEQTIEGEQSRKEYTYRYKFHSIASTDSAYINIKIY